MCFVRYRASHAVRERSVLAALERPEGTLEPEPPPVEPQRIIPMLAQLSATIHSVPLKYPGEAVLENDAVA
jgi:hypothetical protein